MLLILPCLPEVNKILHNKDIVCGREQKALVFFSVYLKFLTRLGEHRLC